METILIMRGGNDVPLWGHCSACDTKFSPRNKQAQRNEQEDDLRTHNFSNTSRRRRRPRKPGSELRDGVEVFTRAKIAVWFTSHFIRPEPQRKNLTRKPIT
jgi:hypothetical protein